MPEILEKLRPDRDLQCYFERPSAIAALSQTSSTGFTASGSWRQQFDWTVIEWNRDNVFEHPLFRYLPDGDLSGLTLSYEDTRSNCIPFDSDLYPTVEWPYLRIWSISGGIETLYKVRLKDYAVPVAGSYQSATAVFQLQGTLTPGDYITLAWLDEHYTYQLSPTDTLETAVQAMVDSINSLSPTVHAARTGTEVQLTYTGLGQTLETSTTGANGNRIGVYGLVAGAKTETWTPTLQLFSGGTSPTRWRITLNFASLQDIENRAVPTSSIRKMRWTYSADLQPGPYQRSDFSVQVSNWTVTGNNRTYSVAGAGSRRIEDDAADIQYTGAWTTEKGNYSGGSIRSTATAGSGVTCAYKCAQIHLLLLGTRITSSAPVISVTVDGQPPIMVNLNIAGEDVLVRIPLGQYAPGSHTITAVHNGAASSVFFFDFVELAIPATVLPEAPPASRQTLATDWDTDHSIAVAPERTAWMIHSMGFRGRVNHYVGALWFYQLSRPGHQYASGMVHFAGVPEFSQVTELTIGTSGDPASNAVISHLNLMGETAESLAKSFEYELNRGYTAVRAEAQGSDLLIYARAMGAAGNNISIAASPESGSFHVETSGATLSGGVDGDWRTDIESDPRINPAAADWSRSFYQAMRGYGLDVTAAFSMELQHGDPSPAVGIAQRYPNGNAVLLNTPALQTNFSPASIEFWKKVYLEMAAILSQAGHIPYLQFGEVQWWYFPSDGSGMPFYDDHTVDLFRTTYGREMTVFTNNSADPNLYSQEASFLPQQIATFTDQIISHVRQTLPACRFEVLYPVDVNDTPFNRVINYPAGAWNSAALDCLKTESFTYTLSHNLDLARTAMLHGETRGFPIAKRSFLVGISDSTTAWGKELSMAQAAGLESLVIFALDQFCLIGYPLPLEAGMRRSVQQG